uniref:Major facilitator superfamily (MFS) profile domain-containing protein n=1 Tax=Moniliophthora roreri TaxID=221103 RepID=A0A0W0EYB5_MONRR
MSNVRSAEVLPPEAMLATSNCPGPAEGSYVPNTCEKEQISRNSAPCPETSSISEEEWYPDGGLRAWLVVLGCFMFACTTMAWGLAWGVLQDYYHTTMFPGTSLSTLSTVAGLVNFVMNATAYVAGGLGDRFGYKRMILISCVLTYICLLVSAFSTKIVHIFLFQGGLLGFAQGIAMPLYVSLPSQWFYKNRGLASGFAVSGSGIGGGFQTLVVRQLIVNLGLKKTMIIYAHMHVFVWIIAFLLIKERPLPPSLRGTKKRWMPKHVGGSFWSVAGSIFFGIFGYLSPYYFSSTYTKQFVTYLDPKSLLVTVPLIVMNFSLGIGRIVAGRLADYFGPINMFFCSFFVGGLLQMVFWTFAKSYTAILVFSVLNGFIGSWFLSLLPVVCASLFSLEGLSTISGFMLLANSPGQIAGSAIGGAILSASGGDWKAVTFYSGGMQIIGAVCILYARFAKDRRLWALV